MSGEISPLNVSAVVPARGSLVGRRSDDHLPPIYSVLRVGDEGEIVIEVLAQRAARPVRGIALTPTQGFARGMTVDEASALPAERDGETFCFCGDHCWPKSLSTHTQCIAERGRSGLMKEP